MRIQFNTVTANDLGKYSISFEAIVGTPGDEYVAAEVESAFLFDNEDDAFAAANRAIDYFDANNRFPDMSKQF